jgi:hypothetical protein
MKIRYTTESYIEEANKIHGNLYDYSKTVYVRNNLKIIIICPLHGEFTKRANQHLSGGGCNKCKKGSGTLVRGINLRRDPLSIVDGKRVCARCKMALPIKDFRKNKKIRDGYDSYCKECSDFFNEDYRKRNKDAVKIRTGKHSKKKWAEYKEVHKEEIEQKQKEREEISRIAKINATIAKSHKVRVKAMLMGSYGTGMAKELLGCSANEFRLYVEGLFKDGMSWSNRGYYGWHLDHIKPCASFNMEDPQQVKECFCYTNYQPLWRLTNQQKGSVYNGVRYKSNIK